MSISVYYNIGYRCRFVTKKSRNLLGNRDKLSIALHGATLEGTIARYKQHVRQIGIIFY